MSKTIELKGRIDTTSAQTIDKEIADTLTAAPKEQLADGLILDCANLDYISSTGLRIILKYKKLYPSLEVINVNNEVYNIFEMTGFSRIISVKKAMRRVSIEGCEEIGRGGVGIIYRLDNETIIKVFSSSCDISLPQGEISMAKEAFVLGMSTAIPFDIVWVPETQSYGLVFELLNSGTLGAAIKSDPEHVIHYAEMFANEMRRMHSIQVPKGTLPDTKEVHNGQLQRIAKHFTQEQVELMQELLNMFPQGNSLLHNDYHPKNVMLGGINKDELLLIDMGEVCCGHPLFELGHTHSTIHINEPEKFLQIVGFPIELKEQFWNTFMQTYFQTSNKETLEHYNRLIEVSSLLRSLMWIALSDYPEEVTRPVRERADQLLTPYRDELIATARGFKDF